MNNREIALYHSPLKNEGPASCDMAELEGYFPK
jgi:hypothetical protein